MIKFLFRAPLALVIGSAIIMTIFLPAPARAVNISVNVGGTVSTFDVVFNTAPGGGGTSFDDDRALIENVAPWWGDSLLARDFAIAYEDQVTPFLFDQSANFEFLFFAHTDNGSTTTGSLLRDDGTIFNAASISNSGQGNVFYAYVATATPVPEIDGGALRQGAVILLAVWLMLRRRAGMRRVTVRALS